ncbi:single-stranded DNA-binding protein [Carnobacterium sp. ISL-102]|uniref:single-stranded DNA-binding protein n=1 Tax=Carnobacterium sp. ISL-102 TaxID=2819142 RepID=UPI001BE76579|nr:single-stranded DNA-binding protein [Carnobacterium sp. ISL-102]MBT2732512.1 single-stranded DNA-binding protein [Carnobacterium sp. ISL-102]
MNQIGLVGRLVREIELKEVGEDKVVLNNTLAVAKRGKKENGSQADFIPIVAWGQVAKLMQLYCEKGHMVGLTGRIQSRSYINKEEETVFIVEMVVDEVHFLQNKKIEVAAVSK